MVYVVRERASASLLARLRGDGDPGAWREFEARYRELILRYCRGRGLQHWDAEDVCQIVMLSLAKAMRRGFRYQPSMGRFRSYLGRVVSNAIYAFHARPRHVVRELDGEVLVAASSYDDREQVDSVWEAEWREHHLRLAMRRVGEGTSERNIRIFDRLLAGDSIRAVAEAYGMTEQGVHKVKQRMRDRVREQVALQLQREEVG